MAKHILATQSPEQQWNSAVRDLELMTKSMVRAYTRKDGTLVKEHDNGKAATAHAASGGPSTSSAFVAKFSNLDSARKTQMTNSHPSKVFHHPDGGFFVPHNARASSRYEKAGHKVALDYNGKPPTSEPDRKTAATGGVKKTRAKANSGLVDSSSDPDFPKEWGNKFKGHEITKDLHQKMLQAHVDAKSNNKIYKYADATHHGVMDKNGREFMPGTAPAEYAFLKVHSHADHNVPPAYKVRHVKSGKEWYFRDPKHH